MSKRKLKVETSPHPLVPRDSSGQFEKGFSGNPMGGSVPKNWRDTKRAIQAYMHEQGTPKEIVDFFIRTMKNPKMGTRAQISAAENLAKLCNLYPTRAEQRSEKDQNSTTNSLASVLSTAFGNQQSELQRAKARIKELEESQITEAEVVEDS